MNAPRGWLPFVTSALLGCASDDRVTSQVASPPLDVGASGVSVVKAERAGLDYLLLLEAPVPLADLEAPPRTLRRFRANGATLDYAPPAGATLADFAVDSSGNASLLLTTETGYALERWSAEGARGPLVDVTGVLPPVWSHDAGRIATLGSGVVLALRLDTNAVQAFRYDSDGAGYLRAWETSVEPANDLLPTSITSGSFDTFGQLKNPFHVYLDVADSGGFWIALLLDPATDLLDQHNAVFGEALGPVSVSGLTRDVLLTRLDGEGRRQFSRVVGTRFNDEIYGLRSAPGQVLIAGRSETTPGDPRGWDGLVIQVDDTGSVTPRTIQLDAADIFFDAGVLADGRSLAVGGSAYTDNPTGASISEACSLLGVLIDSDSLRRLELPSLPRHNHLRTFVSGPGDQLWVAGMSDGPGTHSGDGDRSAIRASAFVATLDVPP